MIILHLGLWHLVAIRSYKSVWMYDLKKLVADSGLEDGYCQKNFALENHILWNVRKQIILLLSRHQNNIYQFVNLNICNRMPSCVSGEHKKQILITLGESHYIFILMWKYILDSACSLDSLLITRYNTVIKLFTVLETLLCLQFLFQVNFKQPECFTIYVVPHGDTCVHLSIVCFSGVCIVYDINLHKFIVSLQIDSDYCLLYYFVHLILFISAPLCKCTYTCQWDYDLVNLFYQICRFTDNCKLHLTNNWVIKTLVKYIRCGCFLFSFCGWCVVHWLLCFIILISDSCNIICMLFNCFSLSGVFVSYILN